MILPLLDQFRDERWEKRETSNRSLQQEKRVSSQLEWKWDSP